MKEEHEILAAAKKRVNEIKGFYYHLGVYIIVNVVLLLFRSPIKLFFMDINETSGEGFGEWLDINMLLTPALWGISLIIHYFVVFGATPKFIKRWEKRKLEQYLEEEEPTQDWM